MKTFNSLNGIKSSKIAPMKNSYKSFLSEISPIRAKYLNRKSQNSQSNRSSFSAQESTVSSIEQQKMNVKYSTQTDIGLRESNEDKIFVIDGLKDVLQKFGFEVAFVVLDGHSGIWAVEYIEAHLENVMRQHLQKDEYKEVRGFKFAVENVFKDIDDQTIDHLRANFNKYGETSLYCGASTTVIFLGQHDLCVANSGDCGTVVGLTNKKSFTITQLHRVEGSGQDVRNEVQRVEESGGWVSSGRVCDVIAISRSLGDLLLKGRGLQEFLDNGVRDNIWSSYFAEHRKFTSDPVSYKPAIKQISINSESAFLVAASDGLWDVITEQDCVAFCRKLFLQGSSCQEVADQLVQRALQKKSQDNVSVLIILFNNGEWIEEQKNSQNTILDNVMYALGQKK